MTTPADHNWTDEDVARLAIGAATVISLATELAETDLQLVVSGNRAAVAISLLRCSMDYGLSVVRLLEAPHRFGPVSIGIARLQLDTFARGAFFAAPATEEEVEYFLSEDVMPPTRNPVGPSKKRPSMRFSEYGKLAVDSVTPGPGSATRNVESAALEVLHSYTHGGTRIVASYLDHDHQRVRPSEKPKNMVLTANNAMAYCAFALYALSPFSLLPIVEYRARCMPMVEGWINLCADEKWP